MERVNVQSSNIRAIGYDKAKQILEIEFLNGGIYQYLGVSQSEHLALLKANSIGRYFTQEIKDKYKDIKIL